MADARGRAVAGWALVAAVVALVIVLRSEDAPAQPDEAEIDMALGGELYAAWCATCHGTGGGGIVGEGVRAGPRVNDVDVRYHDLTIRTGRMPILEPRVGIISDPDFGDTERASLVAWMAEEFDLPGEIPEVDATGSAAGGGDLYATHCAACHGAGGVGGVSGGGATVREVKDLDPVAIVEAIRVGPFAMPRFSESHISDDEARDIATFIAAMSEDTRSPLGLREIHRVTKGALVAPVIIAVLGAVFVATAAGRKRGS